MRLAVLLVLVPALAAAAADDVPTWRPWLAQPKA